MEIIFATNNRHKIEEVQALLPSQFKILSLKDVGIDTDIPEPYNTFIDNANAKAQYIHDITKMNCMAEDSGISVYALCGAPGVFSARFAGEPSDDNKNNALLLSLLNSITDRRAYYTSVISLIIDNNHHSFEGKCEGTISTKSMGENGFGYDPLFIPEGFEKTFGEMSIDEKLKISHRTKSVDKLVKFLNNYNPH